MNVFEIFKAVNHDARMSFAIKDVYTQRDDHVSEREYLRECILSQLDEIPQLVSQRFQRQAIGYKEAEVVCDGTTVSYNLASVLRVPFGYEGLTAVRDFLEIMKPYFHEYADKKPRIIITNNRDRCRCTYGDVEVLYTDDAGTSHATTVEKLLRLQVNQSHILTSWMKRFALDLNKLGPYSWCRIDADMLFSTDENPVRQWLHAERLRREAEGKQ